MFSKINDKQCSKSKDVLLMHNHLSRSLLLLRNLTYNLSYYVRTSEIVT